MLLVWFGLGGRDFFDNIILAFYFGISMIKFCL